MSLKTCKTLIQPVGCGPKEWPHLQNPGAFESAPRDIEVWKVRLGAVVFTHFLGVVRPQNARSVYDKTIRPRTDRLG